MHFLIHYGNGAVTLPRAVCGALLKELNTAQLRVLLCLADDPTLRVDIDRKTDRIAAKCGIAPSAVADAVAFLSERGILVPAAAEAVEKAEPEMTALTEEKPLFEEKPAERPKKGRMPSYAGDEVSALFARHADLKPMVDMAQNVIGKVFSEHETASLVGLYDYYGFSSQYILHLIGYLVKKNKANMRYIESTASGLFDEGILTPEELDAHFAYLDRTDDLQDRVRRLIGAGNRAFTARERKYIAEWCDLDVSDDLLEYAYEQTVDHTGKASLSYMGKVLKKCIDEGNTSKQSAEQADAAFREGKKKAEKAKREEKHSFDADEFLADAMEKFYREEGNS